jgi:RNA polymerase sigma factor (sigma-70 family)
VQDRSARHAWFKCVILPHEAALRRQVRRLTATSGVDVDDVVSEALIRAYMAEDFERIDRGRAFLFTVARNLMTDLARHRAVVPFDFMASLDSFELSDPAPTPESAALARDELRRLQTLIDTLPKQCRRVFFLRRIDELSLSDIAVRLGLSVSTVEKHLSKAMALLTRGMAESEPVLQSRPGPAWRRLKDNR